MSEADINLAELAETARELDAQAMVMQAQAAMIRIKLELVPLITARMTDAIMAESERQQAEAATQPPVAAAERLSLELAELDSIARRADIALCSPDVLEKVRGVERAAACEAVRAELAGKLDDARARVAAARTAKRHAEIRAEVAQAAVARAVDGLRSPLTSDAGVSTEAYKDWMISSGMWRNDPRSDISRELIQDMAVASGIAAQMQRDAIMAYLNHSTPPPAPWAGLTGCRTVARLPMPPVPRRLSSRDTG